MSGTGEIDELRVRLAAGDASDGYHTHNELYQYRMLYNVHTLHAFRAVGWKVTRSWKHHSGETCFGGGWFVVQADTPAGQITNHYAAEHWLLFYGIDEVLTSPPWDGHTPPEAAQRLEAAIPFLRQQLEELRADKRHDGLRRAYEHACEQRDKYMRRTAEWRDVAMNDRNRQDLDWLIDEIGRDHIRDCPVEQCDTCSGILGIEERLKVLDETEDAES